MNDDKDNELMKRIILCLVAFTMVTTLAFCAPEPAMTKQQVYLKGNLHA